MAAEDDGKDSKAGGQTLKIAMPQLSVSSSTTSRSQSDVPADYTPSSQSSNTILSPQSATSLQSRMNPPSSDSVSLNRSVRPGSAPSSIASSKVPPPPRGSSLRNDVSKDRKPSDYVLRNLVNSVRPFNDYTLYSQHYTL